MWYKFSILESFQLEFLSNKNSLKKSLFIHLQDYSRRVRVHVRPVYQGEAGFYRRCSVTKIESLTLGRVAKQSFQRQNEIFYLPAAKLTMRRPVCVLIIVFIGHPLDYLVFFYTVCTRSINFFHLFCFRIVLDELS